MKNENLGLADERFEHAAALEEEGNYAEALQRWRELSSDHKEGAVLCRRGILAKQLGYLQEAEKAFRDAIQIDDKESAAYVGLATVLMQRDEYEEASRLLQKALSLEKNEYGYTMLGVALNHLGRTQEAADNLEAAMLLDPEFEEAYFNLGVVKRDADPGDAERLFVRALEIDPGYADAHRELGWLLRKKDDIPQAEYHLRSALEFKPDDAWTRIYLGNLLWKKGDLAAAVPEFERAITLMPNRSIPFSSLANVYEDQERWEEAEKLYDRAIDAEPDNAVAHMNFARMLAKKGDPVRAGSHLRLALSLDPNYSAARELLTRIEGKAG